MKGFELESRGFICMDTQELQFVRGGVAVACLDNLWDYVKKAFNFIMEYQEDFVRGFKKGWNSL